MFKLENKVKINRTINLIFKEISYGWINLIDLENLQLQYPFYLLYGVGNSQICATVTWGTGKKNIPGSYPVTVKQNFRGWGPQIVHSLKKKLKAIKVLIHIFTPLVGTLLHFHQIQRPFGIPSSQGHPYLQGSRLGPVVGGEVPVLVGFMPGLQLLCPWQRALGSCQRKMVRVMCKVVSCPGFYFYFTENNKKGRDF